MRQFSLALAFLGFLPLTGFQAAAQTAAPALVPGEAGLPALFDCLRETGALAISAHRGGPAPGFPENAIEKIGRAHV